MLHELPFLAANDSPRPDAREQHDTQRTGGRWHSKGPR
eukprot:COSAG04_NODE_29224_length_270_cov_0.906433_1_plen_37_part_10